MVFYTAVLDESFVCVPEESRNLSPFLLVFLCQRMNEIMQLIILLLFIFCGILSFFLVIIIDLLWNILN